MTSLDHALDDSPHLSSAWLLLAGLASRFPSLGLDATELLKVSYYTGPSEQDLVPLRLRIAVHSDDFSDVEIRQFVSRDIHYLLSRKQTSAIAEAYNTASPLQKALSNRPSQTSIRLLSMHSKPARGSSRYRIESMMSAFRPNILLPARIVAWSLATAIAALSVIPPYLRPETSVPHDLEHFLIYAATGLAFGLGYDRKRGLIAILLLIFTAPLRSRSCSCRGGMHGLVPTFLRR